MKSKIIHCLKSTDEFFSGEELSSKLHISRAAIWKHMQELRKEGYSIDAVPHRGYKLRSTPDKLLPEEVNFGLETKVIGQRVHYYKTIPTTMEKAYELAMEGAEEGTVIIAEAQTKGKGRMGRAWVSPKGKGIYLSLILRPQLPPTDVAKLTLLCAVACCGAIRKETGLNVTIKWPNDLLIDGKKFAGILTELNAEIQQVRFIVVGIGINISAKDDMLPEGATSLQKELGQKISRVRLTQAIFESLERWYDCVEDGFGPVLEQWKKMSSTLGNKVRMEDPYGSVEGEAVDLDEYGGLVIRTASGEVVKRMSGDVINL